MSDSKEIRNILVNGDREYATPMGKDEITTPYIQKSTQDQLLS